MRADKHILNLFITTQCVMLGMINWYLLTVPRQTKVETRQAHSVLVQSAKIYITDWQRYMYLLTAPKN